VTAADDEDAAVVPGPRPTRVRRVAAVRPAVRGAGPAGTVRTNDGARPGRTPRSLGAWAGTAGGLGWGVTTHWPNCFVGHQFENNFLQNLVYKCTKH
jgi:hypothetical protein